LIKKPGRIETDGEQISAQLREVNRALGKAEQRTSPQYASRWLSRLSRLNRAASVQ
jgi:hypothetical protein